MTRLVRSFVGGGFVDGGEEFDDINPVDGSLVAKVQAADREMVDRAVHAARAALDRKSVV